MKLLNRAIALVLFSLAPLAAHAQASTSTTAAPQAGRGATPASQALDAARRQLMTGKYDEAIAAFERLSTGANASVDAMRLLLRTYGEVGRYDDAERAAGRFAQSANVAPQVANALGEIYYARGKFAEAEASYRQALARQASDSLRTQLNLAVLTFDRGDRDGAMRMFDRFIDVYNERSATLTSEELTAIAIACRYLGLDTPVLFRDALKAFDKAIAADSLNMEPRVRVGDLFLEKYASAEAQAAYSEVLAINPRQPRALLGVARRRVFDSHPGSDSILAAALSVNPSMIDAYVLRARMRAGSEAYDAALEETAQALKIDPASAAALSVVAAIHYLRGDSVAYTAASTRALSRNPKYADLYITLAELTARNRLYKQAAAFAAKAIELDPRSWPAYAELGNNQLRTGLMDEGRKNLEVAFKGDNYNTWVKNTLDLLDTFKEYDVIDNGKFRLMIAKTESALLSLYATDLLDRAYESYATRYGFRPEPPIRVEFYRRHADFSVRTVGLAGIGALGVSFGNLLAMDSPTGRETGPFSWGSVLWHELGHTFTLGLTDHKIPRWFSEGLSVYEERKSGVPGWGGDVNGHFLRAFKADMLVKVSSMNDGFMRPAYPEQLLHSYYQASLLCDMIAAQNGERALIAMLAGYKAGQNTEQVFRSALNSTPAQMDEKFNEYVRTRFRGQLAAVGKQAKMTAGVDGTMQIAEEPDSGDFVKAMAAGVEAKAAGNTVEATRQFELAITLFPEYAEENSAYVLLAEILGQKNDFKGAADMLAKHNAINENSYVTLMAEGELREKAGDIAGAVKVFDRSMFIYPYDIKTHERLAGLAARVADRKLVVRERRAIVALKPVDMAEAYYMLALALHEAGDNVTARREVLRALEEAPNYAKAQELLLKIRGGDSNTQREPR